MSNTQPLGLSKGIETSALHAASRSNEITDWIKYFVNIILKAQNDIENEINFILKKTDFYDTFMFKKVILLIDIDIILLVRYQK